MDNILKMLLGVLSVAGLIALIVPQSNPLPDSSMAVPSEVSSLPPSESRLSESPPPSPEPSPTPFDSETPSDFQIGAPTIDGNPMQPEFGLPFGSSPEQTTSNADSGQSSPGGFTPPAYTLPGSTPQADGGDQSSAMTDQGE